MNTVSNTAYYCCGIRMDDAKKSYSLCNDYYAELFMDEKGMEIYAPFRTEKMPNISNISRCRMIDDYVKNEITLNHEVYIITIGAGFDTRPFRLKGGNWIEIDESQIIDYKNKKLPIEKCTNQLKRISIDFNKQSLTEVLQPFKSENHTVVVIEGVFMYLEPSAVQNTIS
ncbi:MAG TPA: class I SAM-dependent methyltransferase, partial [Methylophilaceae bacterium]|nr:class I SAM-dependent methyltransferase [Methylophilaceae bacterium]